MLQRSASPDMTQNNNRVTIFDTTLRDSEQSSGARISLPQVKCNTLLLMREKSVTALSA